MRRLLTILLLLSIMPAVWLAWTGAGADRDPAIRSQLIAGREDTSGYARALDPREFSFPADHGPHPEFLTEWWYYTGNLETEKGERFGYQLTFFRRALAPAAEVQSRPSSWATEQVYFAHFSITDVSGGDYQAFERFARGAAGLAGAQGSPAFRVWLEDWEARQLADRVYQLSARQDGLLLSLKLSETKGPVLQGDRGLSPKGPQPGNASYYYSLTALETSGSVEIDGRVFQVRGKSWMDHEFSTSALSADQVGWDWFSIQLDDATELMFFQIRQEDGGQAPASSGTFIFADGSTLPLTIDQVELEVTGTWESPHSGAVYPSGWRLSIPELGISLEIEPLLEDQELNVSFIYWEGAVFVTGLKDGQAVTGYGYVELTGYLESMAGRF